MNNVLDLTKLLENDIENKVANCHDSYELIELFFEDMKINWGFCRYYLDNKEMTPTLLNAELELWMQRVKADSSVHKSSVVRAALDKHNDVMYHNLLSQTANELKYQENNDSEWLKLKQLASLDDEDITVLKTFIWNVKRSLLKQEQVQSPMPVFYSPLGRWGKSTFTRKLTAPINELAQQKDVRSIGDFFGVELWNKLLVVDFDDLGQMTKSFLPKFKAWATQDKLNMRAPKSTQFLTFSKETSPIASSNEPICEIFPDPTGSRRFWQITLKQPLFDALDKVDFKKLWFAVDESADAPIKQDDFELRIEERQYEEQRYRDIVEIWFYDEFQKSILDYEQKYRSQETYEKFDSFRKTQGESKVSNKEFTKRLIQLDVAEKKKDNRGAYFLFKCD